MPTVDVKTAVNTALNYVREFRSEIDGRLEELRLEEVELSEDGKYWLITLGYSVPVTEITVPAIMLPPMDTKKRFQRDYKIFKVNSETNQVESMKIRKI